MEIYLSIYTSISPHTRRPHVHDEGAHGLEDGGGGLKCLGGACLCLVCVFFW